MAAFITFEGIEGSGKSTQVGLASAFLSTRNVSHVVTREPGGTRIGDAIRRLLLHPTSREMTATTELLLIGAARAQHVAEVIRPALDDDKVVLCDRFEDSTRAYQGRGRGLPDRMIAMLSALSAGGLEPGLTFLLDLSAEEGLARARGRNAEATREEARIDEEEMEFHRRVRQGYLELARRAPGRFRVHSAGGSPQSIADRICGDLARFLALP